MRPRARGVSRLPDSIRSCARDVSGLPDSIYPPVRGVSGLRRQISPGVPPVFGGDGYNSQSVAAPQACFGRLVPPCSPSFRAVIRSEANPSGSRRTSVSNSTHGARALGWYPIAGYAVSVTARGHPQGFSRPFRTPLRPIRVCLTLSGTFSLRKAPPAEIDFTGSPQLDNRSRVRPVIPPSSVSSAPASMPGRRGGSCSLVRGRSISTPETSTSPHPAPVPSNVSIHTIPGTPSSVFCTSTLPADPGAAGNSASRHSFPMMAVVPGGSPRPIERMTRHS